MRITRSSGTRRGYGGGKTFKPLGPAGKHHGVSLRGTPVVETAALPDGREAEIRIGVPDDDYVPARELDTVALEVRVDGEVVAALNTLLEPEQDSEARRLAREIADGLSSGGLEPTAGALEPLADAPSSS